MLVSASNNFLLPKSLDVGFLSLYVNIISSHSAEVLQLTSFESNNLCRVEFAFLFLLKYIFFLQQPDRIMPPTFTKCLKRVDGNIGTDVSMESKVSGSQPMTIGWFKDDQEIQSGAKFQPEFKESSATLRILRLEKADSGVYKCRATNSAGFKETSGTLYVKGYDFLSRIYSCCLQSFTSVMLT